MKISFCVTCMNRLYQLEKTLPYNLKMIESMDDAEICLVNYNSADGLDEYIKTHFMDAIQSGKLRYFYTQEPRYFHCSKAKNLAHRLGLGDILFNLDGDNYLSIQTIQYIREIFSLEKAVFLHEGPPCPGTFGRIALRKEDFYQLGGYDELLWGVSMHDTDLISRLKKNKIKKIQGKLKYSSILCIENSKKETRANQKYNFPYDVYLWVNRLLILKRKLLSQSVNKLGMQQFKGVLNFSTTQKL